MRIRQNAATSVSYTHLDVYKRQAQAFRQILFSGFADRPDFDSILITLPKQVAAPNRAGQALFGVALRCV